MLEDYIKHFAGYLGVNPGDQAANSSEENSCHYPDDSLLCVIEENTGAKKTIKWAELETFFKRADSLKKSIPTSMLLVQIGHQ